MDTVDAPGIRNRRFRVLLDSNGGDLRRDGVAQTDPVGTGACHDTQHAPVEVDERAAAVAGIHRRVRLKDLDGLPVVHERGRESPRAEVPDRERVSDDRVGVDVVDRAIGEREAALA